MGTTSVSFEFNVARHENLYGFTLRVRDKEEGEEEQEDDECTSYQIIFKGPREGDLADIVDQFMACHLEARESVGLEDEVTSEEFEEKMGASIEIAGDLMMRHGFEIRESESVDQEILDMLFSEDDDDSPELEEPVVLFRVEGYENVKPDSRWILNLFSIRFTRTSLQSVS